MDERDVPPTRKRRRTRTSSSAARPGVARDAMKRAVKACDSCRSRKSKCDGRRPVCHSCDIAGYDCNYSTSYKKRGLPTGYVRILEALWAVVIKTVPGSADTILRLLEHSSVLYDEEGKLTLACDMVEPGESLRQVWESSSVRRELDWMLPKVKHGEACEPRRRHMSRSGVLSGGNRHESEGHPSIARWAPVEPHQNKPIVKPSEETEIYSSRGDDLVKHSDQRNHPSFSHDKYQDTDPTLGTLLFASDKTGTVNTRAILPPDAWELLDIYFKYNHCWFPVLAKHRVIKILAAVQDETECGPGETALIWAVMAVAARQKESNGTATSNNDPQRFYRIALAMIPTAHFYDETEFTQSLLLLAMCNMANDDWRNTSVLVGHAVRNALLHRSDHATLQSDIGQIGEMSRRVLLGCFVLDTLVAARTGCPPHLKFENIRGSIEFDCESPEEWDQWSPLETFTASRARPMRLARPIRALSTFKEYTKLLKILNEAVCRTQGYIKAPYQSTTETSLQTWLNQLPRHCQFLSTTSPISLDLDVTPPIANLWITYDTVLHFQVYNLAKSPTENIVQISADDLALSSRTARSAYDMAFAGFACQSVIGLHDALCDPIAPPALADVRTQQRKTAAAFSGVSRISPIANSISEESNVTPHTATLDCAGTSGEQGTSLESPLQIQRAYIAQPELGALSALDQHATTSANAMNPPQGFQGRAEYSLMQPNHEPTMELRLNQSAFAGLENSKVIDALLEELSSGNDVPCEADRLQFMQDLGFYNS